MNDDFEIIHAVKPGEPKHPSSFFVFLSPDYNRKACSKSIKHDQSSKNYENLINVIWSERIGKNPRLFNASKFRIHNIRDSLSETNKVDLFLGITDYKDFLGTNWALHATELQQLGVEDYDNSQAYLSDALGVGACVVTEDNKLILMKRSIYCAEASSLWDVPGGHAEPAKIVGQKSLAEIDIMSMSSSQVCHEIFDSISREVIDEVNIPADHLSEPLYIGTHRNLLSAGRPSMSFIIKCNMTSEEVQARYNQGSQQEAYESTNIMFLSPEDISILVAEKNGLWANFSPSGKGNLTTFCLAQA